LTDIKPLTDSGYGPEIVESPEEMLEADPLLLTRMFLLSEKSLAEFRENHQADFICEADRWTETFYDTVSSSLSNAECILKQDSFSLRYWKFFCFAQDNIMEITTDEQEIKEPLSRLLNFTSPDQITKDLLRPFFKITNVKQIYLVNGCKVQFTVADYGFAFCRIERYCMGPENIVDVLAEIDHLALKIGCRSLAEYEPIDYLLKKRRTHSGA